MSTTRRGFASPSIGGTATTWCGSQACLPGRTAPRSTTSRSTGKTHQGEAVTSVVAAASVLVAAAFGEALKPQLEQAVKQLRIGNPARLEQRREDARLGEARD